MQCEIANIHDDSSCRGEYYRIFTSSILRQTSVNQKIKPLNGSQKAMSDFVSWSGWIPSVNSTMDKANDQIKVQHVFK